MWVHFVRSCSRFTRFSRSYASLNSSNASKEVTKSSLPSGSKTATTPVSSAVKDIILFRYEDPRFFNILNIFALMQFGFWAVLSYTSLTMIDAPVKKKETAEEQKEREDLPFWRKINLGSDKYKYGLCIGSFMMGYGILFISWTYILRSVRYLILRKDGKKVAFVTYGPFGKNRIMDVPMDCISAAGSRIGETSQLPVKVKGKYMFYILDLKQGQFPQPKLFDQTVGMKRKF